MSPATSYASLLSQPKILRVFVPALLGRLSLAMVTLCILFSVEAASGSFAIAGSAAGAFGIANVVATPHRARLVDAWGQSKSLVYMAALYTGALAGLAAATAFEIGAGTLVLVAGVAGLFPPPLGASMRVLWAKITPEGAARRKAYSIDAIAEELLFTSGPLIAAVVMNYTNPQLALVLTALISLVGTLLMTSSTLSRALLPRTIDASPSPRSARPLRQPGFVSVLVALLGAGFVLGTVEIAAPAYAKISGSPTVAGLLLAGFAAGSAIGGFIYGHINWKASLPQRLLALLAAMTALSGMLIFADHVAVLLVGLILVGLFLAPTLVTGYLLVDELTSEEVRTEASSWINTAANMGAACATFGVGVVMDAWSPAVGFGVGALAAFACVVLATPALLRKLRPAAD